MAGRVTSSELEDMAEINVTPLVDVMLVLLIIFIITAPMLAQGLRVNLPKQNAPGLAEDGPEPLVLTITADRVILIDDEPIHLQLLANRIGALLGGQARPVYLKVDETVAYGEVIRVMAVLHSVGVEEIGMVTRPGIDEAQ